MLERKKYGWKRTETAKNRAARTITPQALKYIGENFPTSEGGIILDVGCSKGYTTNELANLYPSHRIIGIDFDPKILEVARNENTSPNVEFIRGDGTKLHNYFSAEDVDGVFALNSMTFLNLTTRRQEVIDDFLQGAEKILKKDGTIVVSHNMAMLLGYKGEDLARKLYQETYGFDPKKVPSFSNSYAVEDQLQNLEHRTSLHAAYIREMALPQAVELKGPLTKRKGKTFVPTNYFRNWLPLFDQRYLIRELTELNERELSDEDRNNFTQFGQYSVRYPHYVNNSDRKAVLVPTSRAEK